jgi:ribosomal-protein-alanine N-acetyltransferase
MSEIVLRPVLPSDRTDLVAANRASRAYHAPWVEPFVDEAGFDTWFAGRNAENVSLVARHVDGSVVGMVNISQIVRGNFHSAYLAYYGMAAFARRGLMTEALRLAIRHAFGDLGLHRLEANIQPGNFASIALVHRVGFQKEGFSPRYLRIGGEWRDHERWALVADG